MQQDCSLVQCQIRHSRLAALLSLLDQCLLLGQLCQNQCLASLCHCSVSPAEKVLIDAKGNTSHDTTHIASSLPLNSAFSCLMVYGHSRLADPACYECRVIWMELTSRRISWLHTCSMNTKLILCMSADSRTKWWSSLHRPRKSQKHTLPCCCKEYTSADTHALGSEVPLWRYNIVPWHSWHTRCNYHDLSPQLGMEANEHQHHAYIARNDTLCHLCFCVSMRASDQI